MKVISDACRICKHRNKEASTEDTPICGLLTPDEDTEIEGKCPDFEEEE